MTTLPTEDGAEFDHGGATYRVRIESDPDYSIMDEQGDGMWCGRLEWVSAHVNRDTGNNQRPDDFDGRARKLGPTQNCAAVWWQVPADIADEHIAEVGRNIQDILDWGYASVGLERLETCDHVADSAWLGGVEPFPDDDYVQMIIGDHLAELSAS